MAILPRVTILPSNVGGARDLALTLAGGGNRAFYQLGLLRRFGPVLLPRLRAVAACSAGACIAVLYLSQRDREARDFWRERLTGVKKNFDLALLLRGQRPAPHGPIYRDTVVHALRDGGLERVRAQPFPILVLAASIPRWMGSTVAVGLGISLYSLEKRLRPGQLHPSFGRRVGFAPRVFDARECERPEDLADLILASSATPPFTPVGRYEGASLLDGGMVDNVPAFVAEQVEGVRSNVVLLTRPYPAGVAGWRGPRLYLAPSAPTPIGRWDYTQPDRLDETLEMGERESLLHEALLHEFLAGNATQGDNEHERPRRSVR
jgi:predicted acylesterase/phospholipase RssA